MTHRSQHEFNIYYITYFFANLQTAKQETSQTMSFILNKLSSIRPLICF